MKKIFYLSTCNTCRRILDELDPGADIQLREIKSKPISEEELDRMKELSGSYESLFSRRAMKYRSMGLADQELGEEDYRRHIIDEYTFLKRPVVLTEDKVFVGSAKKVVATAKEALENV